MHDYIGINISQNYKYMQHMLFHVSLGAGVAAVSGVAAFVIIPSLILCVLVAIVVKLRAPCKPRVEGLS